MSNFNAEFTPNSVNYSSDEYGQSVNLNTNVSTEVAAGTGPIATGTQVRKLGSLASGFKASAPFFSSFGPHDSTKNDSMKTSSFKPSPIIIPGQAYLDNQSSKGSLLHAPRDSRDIASQAHAIGSHRHMNMPTQANHLVAVQVQSLDLSFVHLFAESKQDILKLLRDDKFPRFKLTQEFQQFIHAIKPYGSSALSGEKVGEKVHSFHDSDHSLCGQGVD